jgi:hypothetical protein
MESSASNGGFSPLPPEHKVKINVDMASRRGKEHVIQIELPEPPHRSLSLLAPVQAAVLWLAYAYDA